MNYNRRKFLSTSTKVGCAALCGVIAMDFFSGCETVEKGDAIINLEQESALKKIGGAIKKRYEKIDHGDPILIIRESEDRFIAYSALCTHQNIELRLPKNGVIVCPNHGSKFRTADGAVLDGEAYAPLKKIPLHFDSQKSLITLG